MARTTKGFTIALLVCLAATAPTGRADAPPGEAATGDSPPGIAPLSQAPVDRRAFSRPLSTLSLEAGLDFRIGQALFERIWVTSPASTQATDGLGPLYSARSCHRCHTDGGRGYPLRADGRPDASLLLRIDIPATATEPPDHPRDMRLRNLPEPTYGTQLQAFAVPGHPAEYRLGIDYEDLPVTLADGTVVTLRRPRYRALDLGYGPLHPESRLSPRIAPAMIGLGLLDAIDEAAILAAADPDDRDGDGISGRPNHGWSHYHGRTMLGRFGHKAGMPTLRDQVEDAFVVDIGLSTPSRPDHHGDCTPRQTACLDAPHGDSAIHAGLEAGEQVVGLVTRYLANVAVPPRRDEADAEVQAGEQVFHAIGCAACHRPSFDIAHPHGGDETQTLRIWPYTDLLLHDMGDALADGRPEALASGREWRTPPLWGAGLAERVAGRAAFLHDGRARTLLEAILWHGGEAQAQRDAVVALSTTQRRQLLRFVASL
jgi:CxxC motif-containing protein (DUF1111 family)